MLPCASSCWGFLSCSSPSGMPDALPGRDEIRTRPASCASDTRRPGGCSRWSRCLPGPRDRHEHHDVLGVRRHLLAAAAVPATPIGWSRSPAGNPETGRRVALSLDDVRELTSTPIARPVIAAYSGRTVDADGCGGEPERISAQLVTANLFATLGIAPHRGHGFEAADDNVPAAAVALISEALWRRRYQADPVCVGRAIGSTTMPYTIIGVMPPGFAFPNRSEMWIAMTPALGAAGVAVAQRLRHRTSRRPTHSVDRRKRRARDRGCCRRGSRTGRAGIARPLRSAGVGSEERTITGALMGATTVLLLIACANVANLLLARGAGRRREMALRAALGASRGRIMRQLLIESVLLALAAAARRAAARLVRHPMGARRRAADRSARCRTYMQWALDARTFAYGVRRSRSSRAWRSASRPRSMRGRRLLNPLREGAGAAGEPRPAARAQRAHRRADGAGAGPARRRVALRAHVRRASQRARSATTRRI